MNCPPENPYCHVMSDAPTNHTRGPRYRRILGSQGEAAAAPKVQQGTTMALMQMPKIIALFNRGQVHKTIVKGDEITEGKWFLKKTRTECKDPTTLIPSENIPRYGYGRDSEYSCAHKADVEENAQKGFGYFDNIFQTELAEQYQAPPEQQPKPKAYDIYFGRDNGNVAQGQSNRMYVSQNSTEDDWVLFLAFLCHFVLEIRFDPINTINFIKVMLGKSLVANVPQGTYYLDVIPIYTLPIQTRGGTLTKTSEKVVVGNSTRVIYKGGKTRYVKSQHGFMTLTEFLAFKKQKSYKIV
jgi:hypothetical protein